jgi:flagellar biosynthesis chaperone FliJ
VAMSLNTFVNNTTTWEAFISELDERISTQQRSMETVTDTVELYRHQGAIRALRQLQYLRDKVNG